MCMLEGQRSVPEYRLAWHSTGGNAASQVCLEALGLRCIAYAPAAELRGFGCVVAECHVRLQVLDEVVDRFE
jgi:hypothetical protein